MPVVQVRRLRLEEVGLVTRSSQRVTEVGFEPRCV